MAPHDLLVKISAEHDFEHYKLFLDSIPSLFEKEEQRFLVSHYLWGGEERLSMLITHLRLYDLIRRWFYVKFKTHGDPKLIKDEFIRVIGNRGLRNILLRNIQEGVFPSTDNLLLLVDDNK